MKLRKSAALLLAAFMIFTFSGVSAAEAQYQKEYNLLSDLKLLPADMTVKYIPAQNITRGSFASLLVNAVGYEKTGAVAGDLSPFADVKTSDENYKAIRLCSDFGIARGDGAGNFNPGRAVSGAEAVKMIMSALGYDELAKAYGGYPAGYFVCAAENKITSGIRLDGERSMTWGDALKLFANAVDTKIFKQTVFGSEAVYDSGTGETWIEKYHGLKKYSGSFRAAEGISFENADSMEKGKIMVDGTIFDYNGSRLDLAGRDIYYYAEKDEDIIAAITPKNKSEQIVTLSPDDVASFKNGVLTYYEGESEKHITVSSSADTVYNGRPAYLSASDYTDFKGNIKLVLNGSRCNTVIVEDPETFAVKKSIGAKDLFFDMYESGKSFSSNNKEITFTDEYGDTVEIEELGEYDIVSVLQSRDGKYAKLYYSSREISGTLNSVDER